MIALESYNPTIVAERRSNRCQRPAAVDLRIVSGRQETTTGDIKPGSFLLRELSEFQMDRDRIPNRRYAVRVY